MAACLVMAFEAHFHCRLRMTSNNIKNKMNGQFYRQSCIRCVSLKPSRNATTKGVPRFQKFRNMLVKRMAEANRSVLLKLKSPVSYSVLKNVKCYKTVLQKHLEMNGNVKNQYNISANLYLLEFERGIIHQDNKVVYEDFKTEQKRTSFGKKASRTPDLRGLNLTQCISKLYRTQRLHESSIRSHFFVAAQIQSALSNLQDDIQEKVQILPFGSTASGLALRGSSDLDLVLLEQGTDYLQDSKYLEEVTKKLQQESVFDKFNPIYNARVPIVQFQHSLLGINCDLSQSLLTGPIMSEILCWLNEYDDRFYPLMFAVKVFAKNNSVTGSGLTSRITSNSLTMLMLAFLQSRHILPPLKEVYDFNVLTGSVWENTYLKECSPKKNKDGISTGNLFEDFFHFYMKFKFGQTSIDVLNGHMDSIPYRRGMTIVNPFDNSHNMSKNVNETEVKFFQQLCSKTLQKINEETDRIWHPRKRKVFLKRSK